MKRVRSDIQSTLSISRYSVAIQNLTVPSPWRVGRVLFEPYGAVKDRVARYAERPADSDASRLYRKILTEMADMNTRWATAMVEAANAEDAVANILSATQVLRLYQRARYPMVSVDRQNFGLGGELIEDKREFLVEEDDPAGGVRFPKSSGHRVGNLADWIFSDGDIAAFPTQPGFRFVNAMLRSRKGPTGDWQKRISIAIRFLNLAWLSLDDAIRVAASAIAVEVLFSREKDASKVHSIARRSALVSCYFGCGRTGPFCVCQTTTSPDELRQLLKSSSGRYRFCSAYVEIANLFFDRNSVVHQGQTSFESKIVQSDLSTAERLLMDLLVWVEADGANTLKKMDQMLNTARGQPRHLSSQGATARGVVDPVS